MGFAETEWLRKNAISGIPSGKVFLSVRRNSSGKAAIYADASDLVIDGQQLSIARNLTVVRNFDDFPKNKTDGDILFSLDRNELHTYLSYPFLDEKAREDGFSYYTIFAEFEGNTILTEKAVLSKIGEPSSMTLFSAIKCSGGHVSLFMDTNDSIIKDGATILTEKVIVRKKTSDYPEDIDDGNLVLEISKENLHSYANTPFIDLNTETGKTYFYRAFPVSDLEAVNYDDSGKAEITTGTGPTSLTSFSLKNLSGKNSAKVLIKYSLDDFLVKDESENILTRITSMKIVRKEGSYPISEDDGYLVLEKDISSPLSENFLDSNVESDITYFYQVFLKTEDKISGKSDSDKDSVLTIPCIYGFRIEKNNPNTLERVEYTDDAIGMVSAKFDVTNQEMNLEDWEYSFLISSFRPVMLNFNGNVDYELEHDDQTLQWGGEMNSDVGNPDYDGNAMVEVKTLWLKCYQDSEFEYCKVADYKADDDFHAIAHEIGDGTILDKIYLPMFEGSEINGKLRSMADQTPSSNTTFERENELAGANGIGWGIDSAFSWKLIENLLILLSKSTNSQEFFGNGHNANGTKSSDLLKTGLLKNKGMFWGSNVSSDGAVKVFWLENYYGNRWDRISDFSYSGEKHKIILGDLEQEIEFSGSSGGCQSKHEMTSYGLIPMESLGSETTFIPDVFWFSSNSDGIALKGGDCSNNLGTGISALDISHGRTFSAWNVGASPSYRRGI